MIGDLYRVSGSGNDFLAWIEPEADPPPERVRAWCRRGVSLGADGLFVLRRTDDPDRILMDHFNPDGHRAELCGNGARCAAELAFVLGWAAKKVWVTTGAGTFLARRAGESRIQLEAPPADVPPAERIVEVQGIRHRGYWTRLGVPWLVLPWSESLEAAPVADLGPPLRHHEAFAPEGVNVAFVRYASRNEVEMRFWERGVEAETLASGTGTLAAVLVGLSLGRLELPVEAKSSGGFPATVRGELGDGDLPAAWSLEGDARILARIEPWPGADQGAESPR